MSREPDLARREVWKQRLREFRRGTASVVEFCERAGVSPASFYQWRQKLGSAASSRSVAEQQRPSKTSAMPRDATASMKFLPVELIGPRNSEVVEVLLPSGIRVRVPSRDQEALRTVLETLASNRREDRAC
jgi:hypothetical protein